jgi:hypothetical protein
MRHWTPAMDAGQGNLQMTSQHGQHRKTQDVCKSSSRKTCQAFKAGVANGASR